MDEARQLPCRGKAAGWRAFHNGEIVLVVLSVLWKRK